jgi:hypothetical protein
MLTPTLQNFCHCEKRCQFNVEEKLTAEICRATYPSAEKNKKEKIVRVAFEMKIVHHEQRTPLISSLSALSASSLRFNVELRIRFLYP